MMILQQNYCHLYNLMTHAASLVANQGKKISADMYITFTLKDFVLSLARTKTIKCTDKTIWDIEKKNHSHSVPKQ